MWYPPAVEDEIKLKTYVQKLNRSHRNDKNLSDEALQKLIDNCGGCLLCYKRAFCGGPPHAVLDRLDKLATTNLCGLREALDLNNGQQFDAKSLSRYSLLRDVYRGEDVDAIEAPAAASYLLARHGSSDAFLGIHSASSTLMFTIPMTRFALKSLESEVKQAADGIGLAEYFKALDFTDDSS